FAPRGGRLRTGNQPQLRGSAIVYGESAVLALGTLLHSVCTGTTAFDHVHGMSHPMAFFDHRADTRTADGFNAHMLSVSGIDPATVVVASDFSRIACVVIASTTIKTRRAVDFGPARTAPARVLGGRVPGRLDRRGLPPRARHDPEVDPRPRRVSGRPSPTRRSNPRGGGMPGRSRARVEPAGARVEPHRTDAAERCGARLSGLNDDLVAHCGETGPRRRIDPVVRVGRLALAVDARRVDGRLQRHPEVQAVEERV